ncbi:MAG: class IV adenylate cyclase [Acidobacteriota bacterium]|nr:class IV adenylate cyclase [Acidobacteriota bacterium]MDH3523616.1 class IV adenylate cyclase [Acidobacteriota bacterium]
MPRNVEIKAALADPLAVRRRAADLADAGPWEIVQHDTFFRCARGLLKLRRFADGAGELIAYERADGRGPRTSHYRIVPCADPAALAAALGAALGVLGEVRKRRTLWLAGRTRIHLDEVETLGSFLELEVVLAEGEAAAAGEREAAALMAALGVDASELVAEAYVDLLPGRPAV